ncbi:MAG: carboxypeptidase-like regulatory domain-containing protein [Planctomycetota bacterium]
MTWPGVASVSAWLWALAPGAGLRAQAERPAAFARDGGAVSRQDNSEPALLGLVLRADGSALAGAEVVAWRSPRGHDVAGLEDALPSPERHTATTDARGNFHLPLASTAWIEVRGDGVGVAPVFASPGAPLRLCATPLGEVTLPPRALGAYVHCEAGPSLGFFAGDRLHLPAGAYRTLVRFADGFDEHRVELLSGASVALFRGSAAPFLVHVTGDDVGEVVVDCWHEAALTPDARGRVTVWAPARGERAHRLTVRTRGPDRADALHASVCTATTSRVDVPPVTWVCRTVAAPVRGQVATLIDDGATVRCLALSPTVVTDAGVCTVQVPAVDVPTQLVLLAEGHAIGALVPAGGDLQIAAAAAALTVRVVDARGAIADAIVSIRGAAPHVLRSAITDARGLATFHDLPRAPCTLELLAREHIAPPLDIDLDRRHGTVTVQAEIGARLSGRVTLDGAPLPLGLTVELSLRDPTAVLRQPPRGGHVAADGAFAFGGLEPGGRYTLFATAQVDGITYSAKLHGVLAGSTAELALRSEDVPPPTGRR